MLNFDAEDDQHRRQFDHRRGDVEQQEIEHGVDALGAALDHLGHLAGAAGEVEPQAQSVEPCEHIFGQPPGGILADAFEHDIAQIVEDH